MSTKALTVAGVAVVATLGAGGTALAHGSGDDGGHFTQQQAERATAAALDATDGGTANSVERDGENGATWEVEVTRPDGTSVDVRLDESYRLVVIESDSEAR